MLLFVASFLVLFLETAVIRWMPAYVRLLAYFSNFILLASFLGIGIGCLLATRRRQLIGWFPLLLTAVIVAVDRLRLEVALPSTSTIYFSSGTAASRAARAAAERPPPNSVSSDAGNSCVARGR